MTPEFIFPTRSGAGLTLNYLHGGLSVTWPAMCIQLLPFIHLSAFFFFSVVPGMEPRASHVLSKGSELRPGPFRTLAFSSGPCTLSPCDTPRHDESLGPAHVRGGSDLGTTPSSGD